MEFYAPSAMQAVTLCLPIASIVYLDLSHVDDSSYAVARLHVLESIVDTSQGLSVRNELVYLQFSIQVVVHEIW